MRVAAFLSACLLFAVFGCSQKEEAKVHQSVRVTAAKAVVKTMPVRVSAVGTVEPCVSVKIMAQVDGQIQSIHFAEGQDVKKGDLLITIDPAPFKERLRQEEARLAKDVALLKYRKVEAIRYEQLVEKGAVSRSEFEQNEANAGEQEGIVQAGEAAVEQARIDLKHCYVRSPIDGRTGSYLLHKGNIVEKNSTQLVVVNQITPIQVRFSVSEKVLPDIRKYMASGGLTVKASPAGYGDGSREGKLTFIDNTVNMETGMIMLKATFPNTDKYFWPGQFLDVTLMLTSEPDVVVVPAKAVQLSQKGQYVFVVKGDMTAEFRQVTTGRTVGEETVIASGVSAGETVVTDGQLMLRNGAPVEIVGPNTGRPAGKEK